MSLRDRILTANDLTSELVDVPEWDVTVEVRGMAAADRTSLMDKAAAADGSVNTSLLFPALVIACTFDPESGERVFGPDDEPALGEKNGLAVERIVQAAMRVSGMSVDARNESGNDLSVSLSEDS